VTIQPGYRRFYLVLRVIIMLKVQLKKIGWATKKNWDTNFENGTTNKIWDTLLKMGHIFKKGTAKKIWDTHLKMGQPIEK
jgi:hypothetical protein